MKKFWDYLIECQKQRTLRKALDNRAKAMDNCCNNVPPSDHFAAVASGITADLQIIRELQEKREE